LLDLLAQIAAAMQFARLTVVAVAVLLPALANGGAHGLKNVVETAKANGKFTTLVAGIAKANLTATLSGPGNFTVFAPTDAAFTALLTGMKMTATQVMNMKELPGMLMYHAVGGIVKSTDLKNGMNVTTLAKAQVTVTISGKTVKVNDATVTTADVMCSNGVIHIIDKVLMPPAMAKAAATMAKAAAVVTTTAAASTAGTTAKAAAAAGTGAKAAGTGASAAASTTAAATAASAANALQIFWALVVSVAVSAFVLA